jgi:hypothetical protein
VITPRVYSESCTPPVPNLGNYTRIHIDTDKCDYYKKDALFGVIPWGQDEKINIFGNVELIHPSRLILIQANYVDEKPPYPESSLSIDRDGRFGWYFPITQVGKVSIEAKLEGLQLILLTAPPQITTLHQATVTTATNSPDNGANNNGAG